MSFRHTSYLVAAVACWSVPALAQVDQMAAAHAAAANQLGVLEYCQSQGAVGADAVAAEQSSIGRLPASSANTDAAEALGKQGTISVNGNSMTLAGIATNRNTTVAAICKQMGDAAIQTAAAFAGGGATGMPAMHSMPAASATMRGIPAMPFGMGTMPAMPGSPPTR